MTHRNRGASIAIDRVPSQTDCGAATVESRSITTKPIQIMAKATDTGITGVPDRTNISQLWYVDCSAMAMVNTINEKLSCKPGSLVILLPRLPWRCGN